MENLVRISAKVKTSGEAISGIIKEMAELLKQMEIIDREIKREHEKLRPDYSLISKLSWSQIKLFQTRHKKLLDKCGF